MDVNLILFKKDGMRILFPLSSPVTSIGRYRGCDLCIPLMQVSRKHCELYAYQGKLILRDLSSRNGTFLNGQKIDEVSVKAGDILRIGPLVFGVQIDGNPKSIDSMQPQDTAKPTHPSIPVPISQTDEALEQMIKDFSDIDLHQTLTTDQLHDMDSR